PQVRQAGLAAGRSAGRDAGAQRRGAPRVGPREHWQHCVGGVARGPARGGCAGPRGPLAAGQLRQLHQQQQHAVGRRHTQEAALRDVRRRDRRRRGAVVGAAQRRDPARDAGGRAPGADLLRARLPAGGAGLPRVPAAVRVDGAARRAARAGCVVAPQVLQLPGVPPPVPGQVVLRAGPAAVLPLRLPQAQQLAVRGLPRPDRGPVRAGPRGPLPPRLLRLRPLQRAPARRLLRARRPLLLRAPCRPPAAPAPRRQAQDRVWQRPL
ncbi:hypothetical protein IWQ57_005797, partial [Coemansia nantahalensis]